jgi:nitrogen fixation protein FixH
MKLNWGTGIALAYSIFAVAMVGMAMASRKHDPRLVDKDYYNLDLHYQAHLEKKQNTATLQQLPTATFDAEARVVRLHFPQGMQMQGGTAKFFRAVTVKDDFKVDLSAGNIDFQVPAEHMNAGRWHVELDWLADGKSYFCDLIFQR